METRSQVKAKLKRHCDDNGSDQRKSQRLASSAEPKHTTKIIDLNDDCLMKVFGYLDLQNLFNVAIANEWLRPAAREVYRRKFVGATVAISGCDDFRPNTRAKARCGQSEVSVLSEYKCNNHTYIIVNGLKPSLLYLRCFGPAFTSLCIHYNKSESKRYSYIHQYISDYCATALTRIIFFRMPNIAIEQFQKVFVHVEEVFIWDCLLSVQRSHAFVKCFPNVRHLKIERVDIAQGFNIKKPFEHLERLEIIGCNEDITKQLATDLMQGVHQLKSLEIKRIDENDSKEPITKLLDMIKGHPQITKLAYDFRSIGHMLVNSVDVQRTVAEHAALIELQLQDYRFNVQDVFTLIGQLKSLKYFRFQVHRSENAAFASQLDRSKWESIIDNEFDDGEHVLVTLIRKNVE